MNDCQMQNPSKGCDTRRVLCSRTNAGRGNVLDLLGSSVLGGRLAFASSKILADRIGEVFGQALPRDAAALARPGVLESLLEEGRPVDGARLPSIRSVTVPGIAFESSNCNNFLLELEYAEGAAADTPAPRTVYAKLPCDEFATRAFANAVGFWEVECAFCERVASRVPIRVPRVYAVARRGARFVLLLENLQETEGVRLFVNRDMAAGTTVSRARMCLRMFAELHAAFWGWTKARREALLPERLHPYLGANGRRMTRTLNALAITPARKAASDLFSEELAATCRNATQKWDRLIDAWYDGTLTLIHGDSHLANCFVYPGPDGPRMGMIDFQGTQWCKGIRDVQYFLINSLEPELLAAHEQELVDFYVAELAARGVHLDPQEARDQYVAFSFQTLMVAVVSVGLGSLTERDETLRTVLRRSAAASERLDFARWLDAL